MKRIKLIFFLSLFLFVPLHFSFGQKPRLVLPIGHTGPVFSVCFSPDDKTVLTGSADNTAKLWDVATGKEYLSFSGHSSSISSVAFSKSGKYVLTGSWDKTARLWNAESGAMLVNFDKHDDWVSSVAFSSDEKYVATGCYDKLARLWDLESGKKIKTFKGHSGRISSIAFSPRGEYLLTGSEDKSAILWNINKNNVVIKYKGHAGWVNSVAFSPDGKYIATGSSDKTIMLWETTSGKLLKTFTGHKSGVYSVSFSPDGKYIISAGYDKTAKLWDVATGAEIRSFVGHTALLNCAMFSYDGKNIITASSDKTAMLWDVTTGKNTMTFEGHSGIVTSIAFSPDGKSVLTGHSDKTAKLRNINTGNDIMTFSGHTKMINSVAFSNNGKLVITASADSTAKIWDRFTGELLRTLVGHTGSVSSAAFSPDSATCATASFDKTVKLWDVKTGKLIQTLTGHSATVKAVVFSPDGKKILSGAWDNTAKLWEVASGKLLMTFAHESNFVESVAFSPDGTKVLIGYDNPEAMVFDATTGKLIQKIDKHDWFVSAVAYSPDGKYILTGSWDNTAKLSDAANGKEIKTFSGHAGWVNSVAFSPDGKYILTGSKDATTRLWDISTGKEIMSLISIDSSDWVVTSANGLFDASPGAMKLMYYVVGKEPIDLDQIKDRYYEPGLLQKMLGYQDEKIRNVTALNEIKLFPEVQLSQNSDQAGKLKIDLTNRGGGIGKVVVYINGKEVASDARGEKPDPTAKEVTLNVDIKNHPYLIPSGKNVIEVKAYNAEGYLSSRGIQMVYNQEETAATEYPRLFILTLGVSDYTGDKIDLKFAAKDAEDMANTMEIVGKRLFGADKTFVYRMTTNQKDEKSQPTKANIIAKFDELAKLEKSTDLFIVYLSGHGINWGGQDGDFFYLVKDAYTGSLDAYNDPDIRKSCTISSAELTEMIKKVPALKQVLMIDACASGKMVENLVAKREIASSTVRALDRMKDRTGMHIITGCTADAVSYESSRYGQGVLTYSLIEGMKGTALRDGKFIDVSLLFQKARDRVPELAAGVGGIQKPEVFSPYGAESFDIGELVSEDKDKIPLAEAKPMIVMSGIQEENSFDDFLDMEKLVDEALRNIAANGSKAPFVFIESKDYSGAYRLRGRYEIKNNIVQIKLNLFKGKDKISSFEMKGEKSQTSKLANDIATKVEQLVK